MLSVEFELLRTERDLDLDFLWIWIWIPSNLGLQNNLIGLGPFWASVRPPLAGQNLDFWGSISSNSRDLD